MGAHARQEADRAQGPRHRGPAAPRLRREPAPVAPALGPQPAGRRPDRGGLGRLRPAVAPGLARQGRTHLRRGDLTSPLRLAAPSTGPGGSGGSPSARGCVSAAAGWGCLCVGRCLPRAAVAWAVPLVQGGNHQGRGELRAQPSPRALPGGAPTSFARRPVVRYGPKSPFGSVTTRAPVVGWSRSSPRP
ncbi:hypothetical protein SBRY_20044 [Actinacidiphila bryophytorum]|uniref:Uncharacterized protein n=1 Tax=Actinacidiphila bryophytorum TaxID=1436133 RepID=A0A9W4E5Q5_9ACTN|nr:hypothetical protein SBRY_20044 [Actinacidiphila bryophytorum]